MGFHWTTDFNGIEGAVRAPPWPPCAPSFSRPCHCPPIPAHACRTTGCARPSTSTPTRSLTSSTSGAGSSRSTTASKSRRPPRHRGLSSSTLLPRPIALVRARPPMRVICTCRVLVECIAELSCHMGHGHLTFFFILQHTERSTRHLTTPPASNSTCARVEPHLR